MLCAGVIIVLFASVKQKKSVFVQYGLFAQLWNRTRDPKRVMLVL